MRIAAAMLALLAACTSTGVASDPTPSATEEPERVTPSASLAAPVQAIDLLECDGPVSGVGDVGEALAMQSVGGDTPDDALAAFLGSTFFVIPKSGYEPLASTGNRFAYGYRANGEVKVVAVISDRFGAQVGERFVIDELRTCEEAEFGTEADFGDGRRVWTHEDTGEIVTDIPGPAHCGWESARMMHFPVPGGTFVQYLRDPQNVFGGGGTPLLETYAEGVDLPDDATFTGYRTADGDELWRTRSDRAAYVVTAEGVERWPRPEQMIGCA